MIESPTVTLATVPVILAIIQLLKTSGMPAKASPIAAVGFGLVFSIADHFAFQNTDNVYSAVVMGITLGLSAAGLYDGIKITGKILRKPKHAAAESQELP